MNLSFQEKSLWLVFFSVIATFGLYFAAVLPTDATNILPQQVVMFVLAVIVLVILQIVGHAAIAIFDRQSDTDERDRLIALKGTRNGAYVLAMGVFLSLCTAVLREGNFVCAHVLLALWVLAQLVETGSQLYLYRRGV